MHKSYIELKTATQKNLDLNQIIKKVNRWIPSIFPISY